MVKMVVTWYLRWGYHEENQPYVGFQWNGLRKIHWKSGGNHGSYHETWGYAVGFPVKSLILSNNWDNNHGYDRLWLWVPKKIRCFESLPWPPGSLIQIPLGFARCHHGLPRRSWCLVPLHWPSSRRKWSPPPPIPDSQHMLRSWDCRFLGAMGELDCLRIPLPFETAKWDLPHMKMRST